MPRIAIMKPKIVEMINNGYKNIEIAETLHVNKHYISSIRRQMVEEKERLEAIKKEKEKEEVAQKSALRKLAEQNTEPVKHNFRTPYTAYKEAKRMIITRY